MKRVVLSKEIGTNVITRNTLDRFFSKIKKYKSKEIVIDFSNINFISRSGADEYLKLKNSVRKKIKEVNQSEDVKAMFGVVSNKSRDIRVYNELPPVRISTI